MARGRTSMRGRLERLQGEAAANEREREEKRKAKEAAAKLPGAAKPKTARVKAAAKSMPGATRMKMVWAICNRRAESVKTYPFPNKEQAEAELERINAESELKDQHVLQQRRVPMDD